VIVRISRHVTGSIKKRTFIFSDEQIKLSETVKIGTYEGTQLYCFITTDTRFHNRLESLRYGHTELLHYGVQYLYF